jgi:hypothetical protein
LAQKHKTRLPGHLLAAGHSRILAFEPARFAISSSQKTHLRCVYRRYNKRRPSGLGTSCQKASTNLPEPSASRKEYADNLGLVPALNIESQHRQRRMGFLGIRPDAILIEKAGGD